MTGRAIDLGPAASLVNPHLGVRLDRCERGGRSLWTPTRFQPVQVGPAVYGIADLPRYVDARMEGWVDGEEQDILENWFAGTALPNTPSHAGLFTTNPADTGAGGTEVSGGSYAREAYAKNGTNWGSSTAGAPSTIQNLVAITFTTATANWGTVTGWGYFTAVTAGTLLWFAALTTSKAVDNGDTASFAIAALVNQLGDPGDTF